MGHRFIAQARNTDDADLNRFTRIISVVVCMVGHDDGPQIAQISADFHGNDGNAEDSDRVDFRGLFFGSLCVVGLELLPGQQWGVGNLDKGTIGIRGHLDGRLFSRSLKNHWHSSKKIGKMMMNKKQK